MDLSMEAPNTSRKGIQKFVVPPERYISTPTDILVDDLVGTARDSYLQHF